MIYLVAIFLPPLYFFIKGRWIAGILFTISCIVALALVCTVFLAPAGVPLWFIASACAVWDLRKRLTEENATMLAKKMAAEMHRASTSQPE